MPADFDPRRAALQYAAGVEELTRRRSVVSVSGDAIGEAVQAVACGLVYIGDQLGTELLNIAAALAPDPEPWTPEDVAKAAGEMPQASRRVKVVSVTWRMVILELDGQQHQLFEGDTLSVSGLRVEQLPYERIVGMLVGVLQGIERAEMMGVARELARGALAELERFEREGVARLARVERVGQRIRAEGVPQAGAFVRVFAGNRDVTMLVQALRDVALYEEFGGPPPDDAMREIARKALAEFEGGDADG